MRRPSVHAARRWGLGIFCVVWALCSGGDVKAQFAGEARARVEQLLSEGIQRREAGRDDEALELFRQAAGLEPDNARVLAHLGATFQALGRWVSANTYMAQALAHANDPYIQRHRAQLDEALSTIGDHLGYLEVYGAPLGAEALLNGQIVAALPMASPVPVTVGSYLLEVRFEGHYTLGRPISIAKRSLTREEVQLLPHRVPGTAALAASGADPVAPTAPAAPLAASAGSGWLPWGLAGASGAALITSFVAWRVRESYADHWNDDARCLGGGMSREERCGAELRRGQRAEDIAWLSGAGAGLLAAGAILSAVLATPTEETRVSGCAPGLAGGVCFGVF